MNKQLPVNIASIVIVFALMVMPLAVTHVAGIVNCSALLLCVFGFYCIGAALLIPVNIRHLLLPVSYTTLSVFIGGLVFSMCVFVSVNTIFLIALLALVTLLILVVFRKQVEWKLSPGTPAIILLGVVLLAVALISAGDTSKQFTAYQLATNCYTIDSYYFTSIVSSIRRGSIFSAAFETGTPINYQILGFLMPSLLADMLNISSHQALWGMAYPFYQFLALLLCYEFCYFHFREKIARTNYWFLVLAVGLPILMAPLHPLYIVRGVVKNFIFNGLGYLVPAGTITYPVTIAVLLFCLFLFFKIDWKNKKITADKVFFAIGLSLMVIGKIPLYVSSMMFIGIMVLKRIIADKESILNYMGYFICSVVIAGVLFKVCLGQASGGKNYFEYGYLTHMFGGWFGRSNNGLVNNIVILCLIPLTYFLWLGIRVLGLLTLVRSRVSRFSELFIGGAFTLWATTLLASFLHMEITGNNGVVIQDNTFNIDQFIRSAFYIMTIIATVGILHLVFIYGLNARRMKAVVGILSVWCLISMTAIIYSGRHHSKDCGPFAWYDDNYNELKTGKYNDGLIVVNPSLQYYGSMLASSDYGRYWSAIDAKSYNLSIKNEYRWQLYKNMLAAPDEKYLLQMKNEGVKYLIATPVDSATIGAISAAYPQRLQKMKGTQWIYQVD